MNNKSTFRVFIFSILCFVGFQAFGQNLVPFTPNFDQDLKGDILTIGNTILGPSNEPHNNLNAGNNSRIDMQHIDIDNDATTFNSSSAELVIPNPNCYEIRHATLYWGAVEPDDNTSDDVVRQVKFKGPSGDYIDITGNLIYRDETTDLNSAYPYACSADVTNIVQSFPDSQGYYTVANIATKTGVGADAEPRNRNGYTAGWSLFVVYEDPTLPSKSITSFDGFSAIFRDQASVDIEISGFRTVPSPQPVRANLAFATLEGDLSLTGDRMSLNGTNLSSPDRPTDNFFRSVVTRLDATPVDNRIPSSTNTLGFDTGVLRVPNPGNSVINNDDTSATMGLTTSLDFFLQYFFAFAVEIIEPDIILTKVVEDELGNDIGDQTVDLGQPLNYVLSFQNVGNDDATNFTIRDVLPINIIFNYPEDLILPAGVNAVSYDSTTRELVLEIEDHLVEEGDPSVEFTIQAKVIENCTQVSDACSNLIQNQAFATYYGTINPDFVITDDPSVSTNTGCLLTPQATNFLADIDECAFEETVVLCGDSIDLTAADGYVSYSWSDDPSGNPVIATTQTFTATESGTYYVYNTASAECQSIRQVFEVIVYGENQTNPIIPQADEVVTCPNDGRPLPNIFLCGSNDFRNLNAEIDDANSIIWEQLDESSCPAVGDIDCPNDNGSCVWNQVALGSDYTVNTSGQFRLTVNYDGGCFNQFFFNVYQNDLNPTVEVSDILCDSPGTITVNNVPSNYEFSLDGSAYQSSNVFTVTTAGNYTVFIRQAGVPDGACVFTVPDVNVRERDFSFEANATQPLCHGDRGDIQVVAYDAEPQYTFSIFEGGVLVNTVGPIADNSYNFENLGPGTYTASVETEDGCFASEEITIVEPPLLTFSADLTAPLLSCLVPVLDSDGNPVQDEDGNPIFEEMGGEITMNANGGTPPYAYFINSTTDFQSDSVYQVDSAGSYYITVVDANNCEATATVEVEEVLPPDYTVTPTDIACSDSGDSGSITFNVTNTHGSNLEYSIDNGNTYSNSNIFTNLAPGTYETVVRYIFGSSSCVTDPQSVTIDIPDPIAGIAIVDQEYTCTASASISVTGVSGGTPPYVYSIDGVNFQSGNVFTNLTDGTYSIVIQDANLCTFTTNAVVIDPLDPPSDIDFSGTALTCPSNTSDITLTASGGVSPLEFRIIAPTSATTPYQSSGTFTALDPGTYTFEVRDANQCVYSESYTIDSLPTIAVSAQPQSDVSCVGSLDGSLLVTVSGTTNFEYTVNGGASVNGTSPFTLSGLATGSYNIVIRDTVTNCEATTTAVIDEPATPLTVTGDVTPITCDDGGTVTLTASGGWGGYSYTLTQPDSSIIGPQSNGTFTNLTQSGTYNAVVEDINGCQDSFSFDLNSPDPVVASISTSSDICYDGTNAAALEVTVTSGEGPFEYSMNGGPFQAINRFDNLGPGTYSITVRDAYGCTVTLPATNIAQELTIAAVLIDNLDCTTSPDALITGDILGGTGPFNLEVSVNGGGYSTLGTTASPYSYTTAAAGSYQFRVTDAQGCSAISNSVVVNPLSPPAIAAVTATQAIRCNGDDNGAIDVTIDTSVGTPPFIIHVFNNTTGTDYGTQTSGLAAGDYTITLTDGNDCTDAATITLSEPNPIVADIDEVDITCGPGGVSQGQIIVNSVIGGTGPYDYYVSGANGYTAQEIDATGSLPVIFDVIDFGIYQVNIVDANGCSVLEQDILVASPPDDLDININSSVDCTTGGTAVVSVSSTLASSGPFFFAIYTDPAPIYPNPPGAWIPEDSPGSKSATFTGLTPGITYSFVVYDATTMCSYFESATNPIPTNSMLTVAAPDIDNITCTGSADGDVSFTVSSVYGSAVDVSYEIYNSQSLTSTGIVGTATIAAGSSITVSDLGPLNLGNYYVLITENTGPNAGCGVVTTPFSITESQIPLGIVSTVDQNANCNPNSGIISAIGQDGTAPYAYQITTTAVAPSPTDSSWDSANVFNVDAGTYYVHVLDAYGCIETSPAQTVGSDPTPVLVATLTNQCTATEGGYEIEVSLTTAGSAPHAFSIDGSAFQIRTVPFTVTGLTSGVHTIEVRDANGCSDTESIDILAPLAPVATATALPSCDDNDGEITLTATGGTGTYSYSIAPSAPSINLSGNVFSGVPAGTYTITIDDGSCTETTEVTLGAPTPVTFDSTHTEVSCNGSSDGTITVNLLPGNDNPTYTYEITAPITVPAQTSNVFTGLQAGTYTVQVNSGRGCSETATITIDEPAILAASATATGFSCTLDNTVNTSIVTITATGGTAPYSYSINGDDYFTNNTFEIVDDGTVQTIDVFVTDGNGCVATNTVVIDPLDTVSATTFTVSGPIDCNGMGEVTINVTGGSGNFTYQLLPNGSAQASNVFSISEPGSYYFQVNDLDTGCYFLTDAFEVDPFDTIEALIAPVQDIDCFGNNNGQMELTVNGYTGAYEYQVLDIMGMPIGGVQNGNTASDPQIITGLEAGNYSVSVTATDSPFCTVSSNTENIATPTEALALSATESFSVTCTNDQGVITAIASGGTPPYEYELTGATTVPYSNNSTFNNLSAGSYTVRVRDANGCTSDENVLLEVPAPLTATFTPSTTLLSCFGDQSASITVTDVTGGQGSDYNYTLNRIAPQPSTFGPQSSNVFNDLGAGVYSVTVSDNYSCELTSFNITINEPDAIDANLVVETTQTCTTDATLSLSATGGTPPYEYSETNDFSVVLGTFTNSVTFSAPAGTYEYYIRDANGCTAGVFNEITIGPLIPLAVNIELQNLTINCAGDNTGAITATAQGGLGAYTYTLQDELGNDIPAAQDTPGVFTGLVAGIYTVVVESGDCDSVSETIEITEPENPLDFDPIISEITCSGADNGRLEINATGGTGVIKYAISPNLNQFFETSVFENLEPGDYDVIIQDELGCFRTFDFTLADPSPVVLGIVPDSIFPEACDGDQDGSFSIEISGGSLPYSVSLDNEDGPYITGDPTQTEFTFDNLSGGDHLVYVRDSQGCLSPWNISLPESVNIDPQVAVDYLCQDNVSVNTITVTVDNSITDPSQLEYALNDEDFQSSNEFFDIPPSVGNYILVRHPNGCTQMTEPFDIVGIEPIALSVQEGGLNEIIATATGGNGDYEFTFNGISTGSENTYIISETGTYLVTVTDETGCTASAEIYMEFIDLCVPNYFTPNGDGVADFWAPGCAENYPDLKVKIYDRYGRVIAQIRLNEYWDGKYNSSDLPSGDYWYVVTLGAAGNNREYVGHFTLYR